MPANDGTQDRSESYDPTTQTTKLEDFIHLIGDGWCTEFYELARKDADTENTQSAVNLMNLIERCETDIRKEITALIQSEASRIALEARIDELEDVSLEFASPEWVRVTERVKELKASLTAPEGGKHD